jgi:hypothetical protein
MTKVKKMCKEMYHERWIEVMEKWIKSEENHTEGKQYILTLKKIGVKKLPKAVITIGVWSVKDEIMRLMIELEWFYLYPYSLIAEERRIEVLRDEVYYVLLGDVVKVIEHVRLGKVLRKNEVDISNLDSIFHLIDEISKSFSDDVKIDIGIIIKNLKNYESYVEY